MDEATNIPHRMEDVANGLRPALGRRLLRILDKDDEVELVFEGAGSETGELLVTLRRDGPALRGFIDLKTVEESFGPYGESA